MKHLAKGYVIEVKEDVIVGAVASTGSMDRDEEVLDPKGWDLKNFKQAPRLLWAHDARQLPIGKITKIGINNKGALIFDAKFADKENDFAKKVKDLMKGGFLNTFSVGFKPLERDGNKYVKQELLEISVVNVPANPDAMTNNFDYKAFKEAETEYFKDLEEKKKEEEIEEVKPAEEAVEDVEETPKEETPKEEVVESVKESKEDTQPTDDKTENTSEEVKEEEKKEDGDDAINETAEKENLAGDTTENNQDIKVEESEAEETKVEKETISVETGVSMAHKHIAKLERSTGNGSTNTVNDHSHTIEKFVVAEEGNHTHSLEITDKDKKPKKDFRWNKSLPECFNKDFAIEGVMAQPATFEYNLYKKFLGCEIKNIFVNSFLIPSPLLGSYLAGFKNVLSKYELKDVRNFTYNGGEYPPISEVIKLNSTSEDDFLLEGICFYKNNSNGLVIKFSPSWYGLNVTIITNNKEKKWNKDILKETHKWVDENNYLRGEKFSLSGEFLETTEDKWDDVVLEKDTKDNILKSTKCLNAEKSKTSRGMMFIGLPGTGKTKTGRILMNNIESTFIWVTAKDFYKVGIEKGLNLAFNMARDLSPAVLFIEDIDKALVPYGIDTLKTEMDGLKQNKNVLTVLTTNNPEKLPEALIDRPGRFHDILNFKVPSGDLRKKMISKWAGKVDEKLLKEIVDKTEGYSGAHIKELVDYALMIAEDNEISVDKALMEGLKKLERQRELIQNIRNSKKDCPECEIKGTTKVEVTEKFIRVPVTGVTCEITATIDISAKEGISALYCGKEKKVKTYLFLREKGWTKESAVKWVKEHSKYLNNIAFIVKDFKGNKVDSVTANNRLLKALRIIDKAVENTIVYVKKNK